MRRITREDLADWGIETPVHAKMVLKDAWHTEGVIGEIAHAFTPVYNSEILESWWDLPPEYQNRSLDEGLVELDPDQGAIQYTVMMADLHLFYEDQVRRSLESMAQEG